MVQGSMQRAGDRTASTSSSTSSYWGLTTVAVGLAERDTRHST